MIYQKPFHYSLIHIVAGVTGYYYPMILWFALGYQLIQLVFNVRFFLIEGKIAHGNSVEHTLVKVAEIGLGYILGRSWHQAKLNFS